MLGRHTVVAHGAGGALLADAVELVDEQDAGRAGARLLKHVPHAAGAHAHKHLRAAGPGVGRRESYTDLGEEQDPTGCLCAITLRREHESASSADKMLIA